VNTRLQGIDSKGAETTHAQFLLPSSVQRVWKRGVDMNSFEQASQFLRLLYLSDSIITFQTFPNSDKSKAGAEIIHGTIEQYWDYLQQVNDQHNGIYSMVNTGDGLGRKTQNVNAIVRVWADLDGAPLEPVLKSPLKPHVIIQTSPEKFQASWKINPIPVDDKNRAASCELFRRIQRGVAERFGGDKSVSGLCGVARVPGFLNMKYDPFPVRIYQLNDIPAYSLDSMIEGFQINLKDERRPYNKRELPNINITEPILKGVRNQTLFDTLRMIGYNGFLGDDLLSIGLYINDTFCDPPLSDDHLRGIVCRINEFCLKTKPVNYRQHIDRILKNQHLCFGADHFFKFDTLAGAFRILDKRALVNSIYVQSGKRASREDIDEILMRVECEVSSRIPATPEADFIRQNLGEGGKSTLVEIYGAYTRWCESKAIKPLTDTVLRAELKIRTGIPYGRIWLDGKTTKGFYGLSPK
jgi:hypothetical protein